MTKKPNEIIYKKPSLTTQVKIDRLKIRLHFLTNNGNLNPTEQETIKSRIIELTAY
jgi:hypothetical protein